MPIAPRASRTPCPGRVVAASVRVRAAAAGAALAVAAAPAAAEVRITGVEDWIATNVLAHLELDEQPCDVPLRRIELEMRRAPERVRTALEAFGYYAPRIAPRLEQTEDCWLVEVAIELGEPVLIRALDVRLAGEAADDPAFRAAVDGSSLAVGSQLDHGLYEALKKRLLDLAVERGYAEARFAASRIDVYPDDLAADVTLHFDSGPRYRFGRVTLQQDVLAEPMVRAYFGFAEGEPYDSRELTALYVALAETGYFASIDVRPQPADAATRTIPVTVALTGAPRRLITYGIGFSTDTGPRLQFGRNNRRWNDRGHQFGVNAQLSPVTSEITANYRFPYGDPRYQWVSFDAGVQREHTDTAESESLELGARRVWERPGGWTRTERLSWLVEDFEVADQSGRSRLLMPGVDWSRLRGDSSIRPTRGSKLELGLRGGSDTLGSDTDFLQASAEGKWIWSLPSAARFIVRSRMGVTWERELEELPPSVRFFAGGDESVRGYAFESLGPKDESGKVVGGSKLVVASFEYEQPIVGRWSLAWFVDSGNAFNGRHLDPQTGVGMGARWQSPIGPVRVDLAFPLDKEDGDARLHVSLGPDL